METDFQADLPLSLCVSAFSGTSFDPEKRGASYRADYARTLAADYEMLRKHAATGKTESLLADEFARYREGYARRYRAWLTSHSRCISSMITGPSNFPSRRAEKRNHITDRRMKDIIDFRERAIKAAVTTLRPDLRPIMSGDSDACERLARKLAQAEERQNRMKAANAAIRKHKAAGPGAQVAALVALGHSEATAKTLLEPDFCGRIGFADYELTNNNANIRRMRASLASISTAKATPDQTTEGDGVTIEDSPADNRVRLFFAGKPDATVRDSLKSSGFRWAPSVGAWQAYRNPRSMAVAQTFVAPSITP